MSLRKIISDRLQKSIRGGIDAYVRDVRNGNRIKALIDSANFVDDMLLSVDTFDNKKELMNVCIDMAEMNKKDNSVFMEFGVYQGESINYMAERTKLQIYGFDSFEGLPNNWRSGFGKGHFNISTVPDVRENVILVKGWFSETLDQFDLASVDPVFIHIDCDLYESTADVFDKIRSVLRVGCVLLFDEFYNYPGWKVGEYKAWYEFSNKYQIEFEYIGYVPTSEQVALRIVGMNKNINE